MGNEKQRKKKRKKSKKLNSGNIIKALAFQILTIIIVITVIGQTEIYQRSKKPLVTTYTPTLPPDRITKTESDSQEAAEALAVVTEIPEITVQNTEPEKEEYLITDDPTESPETATSKVQNKPGQTTVTASEKTDDKESPEEETQTAAVSESTTTDKDDNNDKETDNTDNSEESEGKKFLKAKASKNADFYQEEITVLGDSIAYGFNAYGFIPYEHNLATGSVSIWNFDYFTIDTVYGYYGLIDAAKAVSPSLLYMSMGMNDVNMSDAKEYAKGYKERIQQILKELPDTVIVAAGITPINKDSEFTSNKKIREYNEALENMINKLGSEQVYYFDAYSVLCDEKTLDLAEGYSSGDGVHLDPNGYEDILHALYNFLDTTDAKKQMEKIRKNTSE